MDFAKKQLEKYGWSDGKGLGKHENGISEALKPKLKRSVTGVGHDAASDFTEHWWTTLYDKAASNVQVEDKNGKTKKIKTKESSEFEITNSSWRLKRKKQEAKLEEQYTDYFVKKAILTSGGSKTKQVQKTESDEEIEMKNVNNLTDEELFAACGGRTAHKGARHGLKALGKLARIEQQEKMLLNQAKYDGYSQCKKLKDSSVSDQPVDVNKNSQLNDKKKRKQQFLEENDKSTKNIDLEAVSEEPRPKKRKKKKLSLNVEDDNISKVDYLIQENVNIEEVAKKSKKKNKFNTVAEENCAVIEVVKKKKKKRDI